MSKGEKEGKQEEGGAKSSGQTCPTRSEVRQALSDLEGRSFGPELTAGLVLCYGVNCFTRS